MRARHRIRTGRNNGGGGNRFSNSESNQLSFNVICLAVAVVGESHTEECSARYDS